MLEYSGVDTVKELENRDADRLAARMADVNGEKNLVRRTLPVSVVRDWISRAGKPPAKIAH